MAERGLQYYLYVSRNKLRMLAPQLPERRRVEVMAKLNVGAAPVAGELSAKTTFGMDRRDHDTLRLVTETIRERELVGTVDSPSVWIEDSVDARWGLYPTSEPRLVLFGGEKNGTIVGLTGSPSSVIALAERTPVPLELASMEIGFMDVMSEIDGRRANWDEDSRPAAIDLFDTVDQVVHEFLRGATHRIGFLAKRLSVGRSSRGTPVILATPLYVELL